MSIMLKSCPRCRGDLVTDRDQYGAFLQCLQCGYVQDLQMQPQGKQQHSEKEKELVLAVH